jgi:hypothetical protein
MKLQICTPFQTTSRRTYQHSTAFSFHLLKLCHEENLVLVVSMPSSTHAKFIVLSASNASKHNIYDSHNREQPPDGICRGHHTSRCQHATAFSFHLLQLHHEENLAPSSTDSKFIVISASDTGHHKIRCHGEQPPDEISGGIHTSRYQPAKAFPLSFLKWVHEEVLALMLLMTSATTPLLTAITVMYRHLLIEQQQLTPPQKHDTTSNVFYPHYGNKHGRYYFLSNHKRVTTKIYNCEYC